MFIHHTILITNDNVQKIVDAAAYHGWTLDHLEDTLEDTTDNGAALVMYFTLDKTGKIVNFNDVPFYDDSYKTMDHTELDTFLELIHGK